MLLCALKLVWDLLSRPSAQTVHPFICLSVYPSVSPLPLPPFVSLFLRRPVNPFILPFIHPFFLVSSVRPSSFLQLFCQSIRLPVRLSVRSFSRLFVLLFIHLSVRFSFHQCVCLSVRLFIPYVDPICPSACPSVCPSVCLSVFPTIHPFEPTLNAYYANQTLGFDENVDCLQVKPVHVSQTLDISKLTYFSFSIFKNGLTTRTLTTQKTVIGTTVP